MKQPSGAHPASAAQRCVGLPPAPESARQARDLVHATCTTAGLPDDMLATAVLLTGELVTNAIVHARTDIRVTVSATSSGVSVQVRDHSPHLPSRRPYGRSASTGRGSELVQLLATEHGVSELSAAGKVVWFCLGDGPKVQSGGAPDPHGGAAEDQAVISLLDLPVALYCAWQQHAEALLREYVLVCFAAGAEPGVLDEYGAADQAMSVLASQAGDIFAALDAGSERLELRLAVPAGEAWRFSVLSSVLDRAAGMAAAGSLLAPTSQPEIVALRRWCCGEVVRQASGLPPSPWHGAGRCDAPPVGTPAQWDATRVTTSTEAVIAADDTNRIIAVSPALAKLLGWSPDELPGRRLVAVIPERFREAHIAGFTRHLVTAEARILDRPVTFPALLRDGHEIPVHITITAEHAGAGRTVFVAFLTPAQPPDGQPTRKGQ